MPPDPQRQREPAEARFPSDIDSTRRGHTPREVDAMPVGRTRRETDRTPGGRIPPTADRASSLAERKRQLVRDELSAAALELLAHQGFEHTTIDQIVAVVGVSRRTFFRYFKSKEDVIIEFLGDLGAHMRAELAGRPLGETTGETLRATLAVFVNVYAEYPTKSLSLTKLTLGTPALRARYLNRQHEWRAELAAELAKRAGVDPATDMRPALAAAVALSAFDTALSRWTDSNGSADLHELVDEAFAAIPDVLTARLS